MRNKFSKDNLFHIFMFLLLIAHIVIMYVFLQHTSIDNDDMCQLDVVLANSLPKILELLLETDNNPPLFTLLSAVWARIIPYGSGNLKLLSQLFLTLTTGVMGYYAKRLAGFLCGIVTAIMCATSTLLVYCCADAFRPYGLLFLTGALSLIAYLHRRRHKENVSSLILYGVSITAMAYTHYFGILTCLALFLFDVILFVRKSTRWQTILPYIVAGLCYIPWLIPVVKYKLATAGSFWPQVPTLVNLYTNCYSKYFDSSINVVIFFIFIAVLFRTIHQEIKVLNNTKLHPRECYPTQISEKYDFSFENLALCLWVPFFVTILDFIYSGIINPAGSMWVERYFIVLYPYSFLLIGVSWSYLFEKLVDQFDFTLYKYLPVLVLTGFMALQGYQFFVTCQYVGQTHEQPYEQVCDYLIAQDDFFAEDTAFLPTFNHQKRAYYYFLTKKHSMTIPTIHWEKYPVEDMNDLEQYNTIYVSEISTALDDETLDYLKTNYEEVSLTDTWFLTKWIKTENE